MPSDNRSIILAYAALLISPLFFSTNVVFGRAATDIAPFLLAFIRWGVSGTILLFLCKRSWPKMWALVKTQWPILLLLGFLGMFICGGIVYLALRETTATNGTLIYTIPPVIIILIERLWRKRPLTWRESIGVALAVLGVVIIVAKGSLQTLIDLDFNAGDLLFLLAACSWALYSDLLKTTALSNLGTLPLFAIIALFGTICLFPLALWEIVHGIDLPHTAHHWSIISGIIVLSSLISFSTFQHGVRILGSSIAGIFLYLLPPFGIGFAWYFLGETISDFHIASIISVLTGVILATFPVQLLRRKSIKTKA
jgi:drug/metabolite transporter (DMT)-like permease